MTDSALARAADDAALDALTVSVETLAAIPSRTICLQLSFSKFGTRRTLDVNRLDISTTPTLPGKKRPKKGDDAPAAEAKPTDKTLLAASKRILESTELRAVGEVMGRAKAYIEVRAVPNSIVADGTYLVPIARVDEIEAELEGPMRTQFDAAVDAAADVDDLDAWFVEHFHRAPISQDTATYNALFSAKEELKKLLAGE